MQASTGDPIIRHMEYSFPHQGFAKTVDQFMLGDDELVAPVVVKGLREKTIRFPAGTWQRDDGSIVEGPCTKTINVPLSRLPWYRKKAWGRDLIFSRLLNPCLFRLWF
ncbi:hypothetical protein E2R56_25570 [Rhodococcus qingshengii]|nr:hypothetical protein E2R56_25570 [Rhodococcus qingshengii]